MRSELIFHAASRQTNRYLLVRLVSRATRLLHWPNTRIADTTNHALQYLGQEEAPVVARAVQKP
jgi:hypothetical protein